jgi:hypothetical protein
MGRSFVAARSGEGANGAAIADVRHLRVGGQRKRALRCGGGNGVEDLAAGGLPTHEVVPCSFPEQGSINQGEAMAERPTGVVSKKPLCL